MAMKKRTHVTVDSFATREFESLMVELATRGGIAYKMKSKEIDLRCKQQPKLIALQRRAYELLGLLPAIRK